VGEVVGGVLHAAGVAGGAGAGLAAERHQPLETAVGTADPGKAAGQDAAVEVGAQVALDVGGQAAAGGAALAGGGEEGLEPLADDCVEEGLLGLATAVPGKGLQAAPWRRSQVPTGAAAWATPAALARTGPQDPRRQPATGDAAVFHVQTPTDH
jgi:hypothetical protein